MKITHLMHVVTDLAATIDFYKEALNAQVGDARNWTINGQEFKGVEVGDGVSDAKMLIVSRADGQQARRDLGSNEVHHCYIAKDFDAAFAHHQAMDCVIFENHGMGLYFIVDPDQHWIEIVPDRDGNGVQGTHYAFVHHNRNVQRLEPAEEFYRDFLGLKFARESKSDDGSFTLRFWEDPVTHFQIELTELTDHRDEPYEMGDQRDALIFEAESLEPYLERGESLGYKVRDYRLTENGRERRYLDVLDPDGYRVFIFEA